MLLRILDTPDLQQCICIHFDECAHLGTLARVNHSLHTLLAHSPSLWFHLALRITGYSASDVPFDAHHPKFKRCVQLLLCPWLSQPRPLSFKLPLEAVAGDEVWRVRLSAFDASTLHFEMSHRAEIPTNAPKPPQYLLSASPDAADDLSYGQHYTATGAPPQSRQAHDAALEQMLTVVRREGLLMHTCKFPLDNHLASLRLVHAGALAVLCEVREHSADYDAESQRYRPESALVVRFFSTKTLRFLRAISCEQVQYLEEVDACFQPCRMWVLNSKRILCYSSADDVRPLLCDLEEHRSGLMEPAFCMLKRGDAASAAHYVKGFLGLNVNQRNLYTFDSLLFAALKLPLVYASTIQPLLDAGADVKARDSMGRTPLMVACALLLVDCVRLLLDKGSDPLALCPSGRNAAFYVGRCHFYLFHDRDRWQASHILRLLYEAGTPMHQRDAQGSVPFLQRPLLMHLECVTLFASWPGFDAHVVDTSNGYTALHYVVHYCGRATFTEAQRVMRVLIHNHRLSITTRSKDCLSPLMLAANAPNHEHVRLLLEWSRTLDSGLSAKAPLLMSPDLACEERFRDVLLASRQIVPKIDTV